MCVDRISKREPMLLALPELRTALAHVRIHVHNYVHVVYVQYVLNGTAGPFFSKKSLLDSLGDCYTRWSH